jgi:hypothetical protein
MGAAIALPTAQPGGPAGVRGLDGVSRCQLAGKRCWNGLHAAMARSGASSADSALFSFALARLLASASLATAWLQLLTGVPSGHDDWGTLVLSYRLSSGCIAITSHPL